jgi:hypothetical protein
VLPIGAARSAERELPASFLRDVENELEAGAWNRPPAFVEVMDPREVRRESRRYDVTDLRSTSQATRLGRALGADLVVTVEIDSVGFTESDTRTERRTARTREGADTAYVVRSGRRQAWANVRYRLVDVRDGRMVGQERVVSEATRSFREASFVGDWRQLLLDDDARRLFNTEVRDDFRGDLMRELSRDMTEKLPRVLYERVLREVR